MGRSCWSVAATALVVFAVALPVRTSDAFVPTLTGGRAIRNGHETRRFVSELEKSSTDEADSLANDVLALRRRIPRNLRTTGSGIPGRNSPIQLLDPSTYESNLIKTWEDDPERQSGFDWEIEKLRRYFAGLRMREDGSWVRQPSLFDFFVTKTRVSTEAGSNRLAPQPVNMMDVAVLFATNLLSSLGFGPALGMAAVPDAVIQKYEGSFFSFIKGVLGGDLQTLAGGPLFLLLAKYFQDYGPIFNLSFGPKSFLVISDPVMARHVLRESPPDQYCKGMLAEILEPIMGKGLIPADPATWKVRRRAIVPGFHKRWLNRMVTSLPNVPRFWWTTWKANREKWWIWKNAFVPSLWILLEKLSLIMTLDLSQRKVPLSRQCTVFCEKRNIDRRPLFRTGTCRMRISGWVDK